MKKHFITASLMLIGCVAINQQAEAQRKPATPVNTINPPAAASGKLDYRNAAADNLIPVEESKRQAVTESLQATVAELLELFHDSKQCHWNLRGPLYLPLHEKLQENADEYRKYADVMAERVLQVGHPIDGRTDVVASTSNLGAMPAGYLDDKQVLILMTERITTVAKRVRQRIDAMSKVDEVTSNQLQELSYVLDKHVWQFRVHMQ